jgi:hypothetical protein
MARSRWHAFLAAATVLAAAPAAMAQQLVPHVGYAYPAGGKQGATFEVVIGGQYLEGVNAVHFSGGAGVQAKLVELIKPMSQKEYNDLRIKLDDLMARRAVVRNDFKALENFKSFKNAKNVKDAPASDDKEIEELKKKYAKASWTAEDEKQVAEVRRSIATAVRRPANPAISELAVVQVTVAPDAAPGRRELRIAAPTGVSNPLAFCVGQLPEFSKKAVKTITEQRPALANPAFESRSRPPAPEMTVTLPAVVNGQILPGAVDRFRFRATKGQRLVVAASARELIPYLADAVPGWFQAVLAVYDAKGKELAYADRNIFRPDPALYFEVPDDGEYVVEIKDAIYRGREDFVYRIEVGEMPLITSLFPLGGQAGAQTAVELKGWNLPVAQVTMNARAKTPGIYPVTVSQGSLVSNPMPFAVDTLPECMEKEPNNTRQAAQAVALPVIVNGRIDQPDDCDVFRFDGRAGDEVVAEVCARRLNSPLDSVLTLTDAAGKQLAFNDDYEDKGSGLNTHHADSYLRFTLPANGTYYVHLADGQHKGGPLYAYRLRISWPRPDFDLRVVPASITIRGGSTVPITVYALRKDGFSGDIDVALKGAPAGFALGGARVPSGQDQVRMTLTVPPTPSSGPISLSWEGRATVQGRQVVRAAVPAEDMMQAFAYRHLVPAQDMEAVVTGRNMSRSAIRVLGETPVKIPAGGTARVQIGAPTNLPLGKLYFELSDPPEGISVKNTAPGGMTTEMVLHCDASKAKAGLKGNLIVNVFFTPQASAGKATTQAAQRRNPAGSLPAIPFEVVAPPPATETRGGI